MSTSYSSAEPNVVAYYTLFVIICITMLILTVLLWYVSGVKVNKYLQRKKRLDRIEVEVWPKRLDKIRVDRPLTPEERQKLSANNIADREQAIRDIADSC